MAISNPPVFFLGPGGTFVTSYATSVQQSDEEFLVRACQTGNMQHAEIALAVLDPNGKTYLHIACVSGHLEIAQLLLANNASVHDLNIDNGKTPLHYAATPEIAQLLLDNGADPLAQDYDSMTPLFEARSKEIAEILIRSGINVHQRDKDGNPLIHQLIKLKLPPKTLCNLLEALLKHGAKVNGRDLQGNTPLHLAMARVNLGKDCLILLLNASANIRAENNEGKKPLAYFKGNWDVKEEIRGLLKEDLEPFEEF